MMPNYGISTGGRGGRDPEQGQAATAEEPQQRTAEETAATDFAAPLRRPRQTVVTK